LVRDVATTLAVPVAAWVGLFAADTLIRSQPVHGPSLLTRGGVYPAVRWGNLVMFVVITVIGLGLTTATVTGLSWEGYLFSAANIPLGGDIAQTDIGVLVALLLAFAVPIVTGIPAVRRQERSAPRPE
ncbi:MAG TPA: hypothetical protein VGP24_12890, partial [Glaciihabitans sp.]|nr:hypothetical protein [Glaciihabitans sp.]